MIDQDQEPLMTVGDADVLDAADGSPELVPEVVFAFASHSITNDAAIVTMAKAFGCKTVLFRERELQPLHVVFDANFRAGIWRFEKYLSYHKAQHTKTG